MVNFMNLNIPSSIIIDKHGSYLQKIGNRFAVKYAGDRREYSADKISQIIFVVPSAISSEAIKLAVDKNIDLVYLDFRGNPYARTYRTTLGGTTLTRKKQLEATISEKGTKLVIKIVEAKISSQLNFIKSLSKDRKSNLQLKKLVSYKPSKIKLNKHQNIDSIRQSLLGMEGAMASIYFRSLGFVTGFSRRDPKLNDEFNICLNYAYGILYSEVERACILAGLDPYLGFYHTDRYGKPCLVLDLIELFRVAVADRATVTLFTRKEVNDKDFDRRGSLTLSDRGRKKIITAVVIRLNTLLKYNGKKLTLKNIMLSQTRELASYLLGHKRDYKPFVYK